MAYRIDYSSAGNQRKPMHPRLSAPVIKTTLFVVAVIAGAVAIKTIGLTWVRDILLPGDPEVTAAALQNMTDGLRSGDSLLDAVTAFCREIVANAS